MMTDRDVARCIRDWPEEFWAAEQLNPSGVRLGAGGLLGALPQALK
ncbi:MAG: hypothetical protein R3200_01275 [Xanthomonadales bacterium]|nr:hypothetical protein [Xanthomonadales bacterium]